MGDLQQLAKKKRAEEVLKLATMEKSVTTAIKSLQDSLNNAEDEGVLRDDVDDVIVQLSSMLKSHHETNEVVTPRQQAFRDSGITVNKDFVAPKTTPRPPKPGLLKRRDRGIIRGDNE